MPGPTQGKRKKVFAGNAEGKRLCGYRLVGYETIDKGSCKVKRELREPVLEGEGKYKKIKLPKRFLKEFMVDSDKVPDGLVVVSTATKP